MDYTSSEKRGKAQGGLQACPHEEGGCEVQIQTVYRENPLLAPTTVAAEVEIRSINRENSLLAPTMAARSLSVDCDARATAR